MSYGWAPAPTLARDFDGADSISGGLGEDELQGGIGDDILSGDEGDDVLYGGAGSDTFMFAPGFGVDGVLDFEAGSAVSDVIEFSTDLFADFTALMAATTDFGTELMIEAGDGSQIWLIGVSKASLHQNDFAFV